MPHVIFSRMNGGTVSRFFLRMTALGLALGAAHAHGGLHLGAKLACKKYGDAYSIRDRAALRQAVTPDFAAVWDQVPDDIFQRLPKADATGNAVLSSSKSQREARVEVATTAGTITFVVVGAGFQWKVDDLLTPGDDGQPTSLKNRLLLCITAKQFLSVLQKGDWSKPHPTVAPDFHTVLAKLPFADRDRVRRYLPSLPKISAIPKVSIGIDGALMTVSLPTQHGNATVYLTFQRRATWQVRDVSVKTPTLDLPSLARSMPALVAVATMGDFFKQPRSLDPRAWTLPGKLQDELVRAFEGKCELGKSMAGKPQQIIVFPDGKRVQVRMNDKWVIADMMPTPAGPARVASLMLHDGNQWRDTADLLALQRKVLQGGDAVKSWLMQVSYEEPEAGDRPSGKPDANNVRPIATNTQGTNTTRSR